jgi:hypothetical protein
LDAIVAAMAKMLGRCRGRGTGPRSGSSAGSVSVAAVRVTGGGEDGASRGAAKSGGLVAFGLGQAMPRSDELGPLDATLSLARGVCLSSEAGAVPVGLVPVAASPVAAGPGIAGEGVCIDAACGEESAEPVAPIGEGFVSGSEAALRGPLLISPVGFTSLAVASSPRGDVD